MFHCSRAKKPRREGFTLSEVMITLSLVALLCLGVFGGLQTISKLSLGTVIRSEAHRLLQAEAERLTAVDYASFVAASDQTLTSNFRTTFVSGNEAQFSYPGTGSASRVTFTRRVVQVASTASSRTLRVEIEWTWQGRFTRLTMPLFRGQ